MVTATKSSAQYLQAIQLGLGRYGMKKIFIYFMFTSMVSLSAAPSSDALLLLHNVDTATMNAMAANEGSLVFNSDDEETYEHNATQWRKITSDGSETKIIPQECIRISGTGTSADPYSVHNNPPAKTQASAGTTCKQILEIGCPVTSGMYWINPDGGDTSNAFEVYCDMTTDGGGWTKIEYASDLPHMNRWSTGDARRWLPSDFSLVLNDTQINNIRAHSTEGKQRYRGTTDGVMHYWYHRGDYRYAFGFRFHNNDETVFGQASYDPVNITVVQDGGYTNTSNSADTVFDINDTRVPIINVYSRDSGNPSEQFGSPLTKNPAWLR